MPTIQPLLPDATATKSGKVNTGAQTFGGLKTFQNGLLSSGDITAGNWLQGSVGSYLAIRGRMTDGASALGAVVDTENTLTTSGAKILSLRTGGSEKAYFDKDGKIAAPALCATFAGSGGGVVFGGPTGASVLFEIGSSLLLRGRSSGADLDANTPAVIVAPYSAVDATDSLFQVRISDGTPKFSVNASGDAVVPGKLQVGSNTSCYFDFTPNYMRANGAAFGVSGNLYLIGNTIQDSAGTARVTFPGGVNDLRLFGNGGADSSSYIGVTIASGQNLATAGSKIARFANSISGTTGEKAYIGYDGKLAITGVTSGSNAIEIPSGSRMFFGGGNRYLYDDGVTIQTPGDFQVGSTLWSLYELNLYNAGLIRSNAAVISKSYAADSSSAIAAKIDTNAAWSTSGAKLLSICLAGTEKASVDKDGGILCKSVNTNGAGSLIAGGTQGVIVGTAGVSVSASSFSMNIGSGWGLTDANTTEAIKFLSTTVFATGTRARAFAFYHGNPGTRVAHIDLKGNFENEVAGEGIILTSPNGTRYQIKVSDGGVISAAAAP